MHTSQRGLHVTTLYVAGSRSTKQVSVKHNVRRTGSDVRGLIFCTVNSAQDVKDSSELYDTETHLHEHTHTDTQTHTQTDSVWFNNPLDTL